MQDGCAIVAGALVIETGAGVSELSPPASALIAVGSLRVRNNPDLVGLSLPGLLLIRGTPAIGPGGGIDGLRVENNAHLASLSFPALGSAVGDFDVSYGNPMVATLAFPVLTAVDGSLWVGTSEAGAGNPALTHLEFPALVSVSGQLNVDGNGALATVRLTALEQVGGLGVGGTAITSLDVRALKTVTVGLNVIGTGLTTLGLPSLTTVTIALDIEGNNALTEIDVPLLASTRNVRIGNAATTVLALPALATVTEDLELSRNSALATIELPALTSASGIGLIMLDDPALTSVSLPALTTVNGILQVYNDGALTSLNLPVLTAVTGDLDVSNNEALRQCIVEGVKNQLTTGPASFSSSGNNGMPDTCP